MVYLENQSDAPYNALRELERAERTCGFSLSLRTYTNQNQTCIQPAAYVVPLEGEAVRKPTSCICQRSNSASQPKPTILHTRPTNFSSTGELKHRKNIKNPTFDTEPCTEMTTPFSQRTLKYGNSMESVHIR